MRLYIGNTDTEWFFFLNAINPEDVNFWQPGGISVFKVLEPGAPFLFRLKRSLNKIAGVSFFSSHTFLPTSVAWETFGIRNGCNDYVEFRKKINQYRQDKTNPDPTIGCIILTNPIFFKEKDWIDVPHDWNRSIVQGKSYSMDEGPGCFLWLKVEKLVQNKLFPLDLAENKSQLILEEPSSPDYRLSVLQKVRLGQGAFRVLIIDAYKRRCAISGERTLPVLEAAHIKPFAQSGPNFIKNGLLVRSDMHKLFDTGYITVTQDFHVEVSGRIKLEYENGKEYYKFHGQELINFPNRQIDYPDPIYLCWHNENIYKG